MSDGKAPRVLVVDDHPRLRDAMCAALRSYGCLVQASANGSDALERLARDRFDIVVSDVGMPVMDGVTLRGHVLARHPHLRRRFLLCSGQPLPPALADDVSVAFLSKPVGAENLWTAVRALLAEPLEATPSPG